MWKLVVKHMKTHMLNVSSDVSLSDCFSSRRSGPLLPDFGRLSAPQTLDMDSSANCGKKKKKKRRHR